MWMKPDIERAYRLGANSYLTKPPTPQKLDAPCQMPRRILVPMEHPSTTSGELHHPAPHLNRQLPGALKSAVK